MCSSAGRSKECARWSLSHVILVGRRVAGLEGIERRAIDGRKRSRTRTREEREENGRRVCRVGSSQNSGLDDVGQGLLFPCRLETESSSCWVRNQSPPASVWAPATVAPVPRQACQPHLPYCPRPLAVSVHAFLASTLLCSRGEKDLVATLEMQ